MVPGRIENQNIIMDGKDVKTWDIDVARGVLVTMLLADHFATIGKHTYFVNLGWMAQAIYQLVYYLLPEFTRN